MVARAGEGTWAPPHIEVRVRCAQCGTVYCVGCHRRCPTCGSSHIAGQGHI